MRWMFIIITVAYIIVFAYSLCKVSGDIARLEERDEFHSQFNQEHKED